MSANDANSEETRCQGKYVCFSDIQTKRVKSDWKDNGHAKGIPFFFDFDGMTWGYDKENGPDTWVNDYPVAAGVRQSPIDIKPEAAVYDKSLANNPLTIDYKDEADLELENPGLSFKANISAGSIISGGPLGEDKYKLVQFHFHWSHEDAQGSEHTVNGATYPSELHLVHYNADKYTSFTDAVTQSDGLAVLGVFINVEDKENEGFKTLADNSDKVKCKGTKINTGSAFNPATLLPENTRDYWTYEGSLTTPPLCESVRWMVLKSDISISKEQMKSLRSLCCDDCGAKPIPDNFRPPLPVGVRDVKASFQQ